MIQPDKSQVASQASRRDFLKGSTGAVLAAGLSMGGGAIAAGEGESQLPATGSSGRQAGATAKAKATSSAPRGCPPEIRAALSGPWPTIRTPFTQSGDIDYPSLYKMLDFMIEEGKAKAIVLTWGDSLFSILTDDEIAQLTKIVTQHVKNRAFVVAATGAWWTGKSVDFAKYCREIEADMLMALPPNWPQSTSTVDTLVAYYQAVSEHIPVMVVAAFGLELIGRLLRETPRVMALKDDFSGEFIRKACLLAHDHWALSAGGRKENHMNMYPYGVDGYLSTFITFKPDIAWHYWQAIETDDIEVATAVIRDYDMPFFDYITKVEGSFDAAMHGIYELFGLAKRWRRPPYHSLTDEQMEQLAEFLKSKNIS